MNLQPLKILVPGRAMLVMLLLLALGLGWYYVSSSAQGSHLVRRNFNHLNQITANIDASVDALHAQVRFNQGAPCPDAEDEESCLKSFKKRLAGNSPLIRDESAIRAEIDDIVLAEDMASEMDGEDAMPEQVQSSFSKQQVQSPPQKYTRFTELQQQNCVDPDTFAREAEQIDSYLVDGGIGNSFFVDVNLLLDEEANSRNRSRRPGSGGEQRECLDRSLALYLEIDLYFDLIQGLSQSEGYFDSIIIARAEPKGASSDEDWYYEEPLPEIIFNTASGEPYANSEDLQSIFSMRSGFERYRSIADLKQQHGVDRYRAALLPGDNAGKNPVDIAPQSFTHSTVVPFEVGGFKHLAFVQPLELEDIGEDLLIIGVVDQGRFNALKYRVPLNYLSLLLVAFLVVLLSLNFIRLALLGKRGVLLKRDLHLSYISLVGMASLITILIGNIGASMQLNAMFDEDQQSIFDRVRSQFELELLEKLALMVEPKMAQDLDLDFCESEQSRESIGRSVKVRCGGDPVPHISALLELDASGQQTGTYRTHLASSPTPPFNLSSRNYFKAALGGEAWRLDASRLRKYAGEGPYAGLIDALDGQRYYMQRIESYVDSTLETAISVPLHEDHNARQVDGVRVAVVRFRSLEDVVLPPGFGLAVFESQSGRVLFHDDYRRSLRENFYRATDDDPDLKAGVIAGVKMGLDLNYKGDSVHAAFGPLADTPWTMVVYYREPLVDVINFHFGVTASVLSALFIILFLLGSGVLAMLVPRVIQAWRGDEEAGAGIVPDWIYPMDGKASVYVDLTGMNLGLLLLYTGVTYHLDITDSWPWLLLAPAVIFGLWHRQVQPEFYRGLPGLLRPLGLALPYGFALLLVVAYARLLILNNGSVYLGVSLLCAAALYLALRFNEARKRRALERMPRQHKLAGMRARDLVNYRRATCVFILMLSVSPTILLYNENFDVHEKLWVEFTNWSNSDRLRDRSKGYESYSQRTHQSGDLGDFLLENWQGVYLPRTEVFSLTLPEAGIDSLASPMAGLAPQPEVDRWPPLREKYGLPDNYDREFTLYMLVARDRASVLKNCHVHINLDSEPHWQCARSPRVDEQVALLKSLVKALPSFSATGSLLESFTERSRIMHAMGDEAGKDPTMQDQPALVAIDEYDRATGLHYLMSTVFPHTRSEYPQVILIPYFLFLLISGIYVYLLTGFLADRQLGGRFARRKSAIDREANHDEILAGGLMVVPAGMDLETAYQQLVDSEILKGQNFEVPQSNGSVGLKHVAVSDDMIILKDFFSVIDNRSLAVQVVSFLEAQLSAGKRVIVLSDIDPKYWLRSQHVGDTLPAPLFHRWESLLMSLHSYCLFPPGRVCAAPDPSCFRRIWERSSKDEKLLLAGLHYENVVNYRNLSAGISLYRRGVLTFRDFQYHFINAAFARFVERQLPRDEFRREAAGHENKVWLAFKGPIMLALLVMLGFIAYTAQDEMRIVFSVLTTVSGTLVAVGAFSERIRSFRSYLGG